MPRQTRRRKRDYFDPPTEFVPFDVKVPKDRCTNPDKPGDKGKVRYDDEIDCKLALANMIARDSTRRFKVEQRAYLCPFCEGWHTTSQPMRTDRYGNALVDTP